MGGARAAGDTHQMRGNRRRWVSRAPSARSTHPTRYAGLGSGTAAQRASRPACRGAPSGEGGRGWAGVGLEVYVLFMGLNDNLSSH